MTMTQTALQQASVLPRALLTSGRLARRPKQRRSRPEQGTPLYTQASLPLTPPHQSCVLRPGLTAA